MNERQKVFTRLNLSKNSVARLEIVRDIDDFEIDGVREAFKEFLADGRFQHCMVYQRDRIVYQITIELDVSANARYPYFALRYEVSPNQSTRQTSTSLSRQQEHAFLQRCSDDPTEYEFRCDVDFFFRDEPTRQARYWFPLPLKMPPVDEDDSGPISEIRGIRGVKLVSSSAGDDDLIAYSFILDRPFNSNVALHVDFVVSSPLTGSLPNNVISGAREVATALGIA